VPTELPPRRESAPVAEGHASDPGSAKGAIGLVLDGKWRLTRVIGRGGRGVVYEAQHVAFGKRVALKFIEAEAATDPEMSARFRREAEAASAVESAHIVHIFDTGVTPAGAPYLVMELLRGETLGERIRRAGPLSVTASLQIVGQVLRGLSPAHRAGVIHRDLKPDNLFLVEREDDEPFVKILDFGISKITRETGETGMATLTRKGAVLGTPYYMSPEQAQGDATIDARTDIFSLGAILYECLTGQAPHAEIKSYEGIIVARCTRDPIPLRQLNPDVPEALEIVVARALARNRDARYASAHELLDALCAAAPGVIPQRTSVDPSERPLALSGAASPSDPANTHASWSSRGASGVRTPTLVATKPPRRRRYGAPIALGVAVAAAAFGLTFALLRLRTGDPSGEQAAVHAPAELRVVASPATARVLVDGVVAQSGVVRGAQASKHHLRVEADGYETAERDEVLGERPELRVTLAPAGAALAPANAAVAPAGSAAAASAASSARSLPDAAPATAAASAGPMSTGRTGPPKAARSGAAPATARTPGGLPSVQLRLKTEDR
jgi:serine/threonine protein kinase